MQFSPKYPERPHKGIVQAIKRGETSFANNPSLPEGNYLDNVASAQFQELLEKIRHYYKKPLHSANDLVMAMYQIHGEIQQIESTHVPELAQLAVKLVSEAYGVNEDELQFKIQLGDQDVDVGGTQEEAPQSDVQADPKEVHKRNMVNALIQGAGLRGQYLFHMASGQLSQISPDLVPLYGLLMSLGEYAYWIIPPNVVAGMAGGTEQVKLDEEVPQIKASATVFPVLLQELVKGVVELVSMHGLPSDAGQQQAVLNQTDTLQNEMWAIRFGKEFWDKFMASCNVADPRIRMKVYEAIISLPADTFHALVKGILASDPAAITQVNRYVRVAGGTVTSSLELLPLLPPESLRLV